jgi:uridine kinase
MTVPYGTTLLEASKQLEKPERPFLIATADHKLQDLSVPVIGPCDVAFLDITDPNGFRAYQRSAAFLMIYAAKTVLGKKARIVIEHSINKNYYCELLDEGVEATDALLERIEQVMAEAAEKDMAIERLAIPVEEALEIAEGLGMYDKVSLLKYRRTSYVNLYRLDWFYDYFYGQMVPSTGYITAFKLERRNKGFILRFPSAGNNYQLTEAALSNKIFEVFSESNYWARILKVDTVGALNDILSTGGIGNIMRVNEALHEKKIAYLADRIFQERKRIVLIAGPSSSGKTTFAQRLCVQLQANGLRPSTLSLDDYFVDREFSPRDSEGNYDFETPDAIDINQINKDLMALLSGEAVNIPVFNFIIGKREYKGRTLKLSPNDILVIEGIHGLNERISENIPRENKFKIFVSALTQINIDDHNRIPTTDTRLIRRMVRDYRTRGADPAHSIRIWPSVIRGENINIFPFQEEADSFFNSALVYEMCVLKQFAEPLLFSVPRDAPEYTEAQRLVKFLDSFLGVSSEHVANNSILREFIGGGCFEYRLTSA